MKLKLVLFCILLSSIGWAQNKISGKITDETNGEPLIGASVVAKGTTVGTVTDVDGNFSFDAPANVTALTVSYVGYAPQEIAVTPGQTAFTISMIASNTLNDVVVVGYGTQTKTRIVGSVSTISSRALDQIPFGSLDNMLQGQATGVQVTGQSGRPGAPAFIRIRGVGSISAGRDPLYVVDGVALSSDFYSLINSNDVESISVLKDAASASIYGSRAANGVILVTTKKGTQGKKEPQVSLRFQKGVKTKTPLNYSLMNQQEKLQYESDLGFVNQPITDSVTKYYPGQKFANLTDAQRQGVWNSLSNTDWDKTLFRNANFTSYEFDLNGGDKTFNYYFSLQNYDEEGTSIGSSYNRKGGRINLEYKPTDWFKMGSINSISVQSNSLIRDRNNVQGTVRALNTYNSYEPEKLSDGSYNYTHQGFSVTEAVKNNPETDYTIGGVSSLFAELTPVKNLILRSSIGLNLRDYSRESYIQPGSILDQYVGDPNAPGIKTDNGAREYNYVFTNTAQYIYDINNENRLVGLAGIEFTDDFTKNYSLSSKGYPTSAVSTQDNGATATAASTSKTEWSLYSVFGRLSYSFSDRFALEGSIRQDGSSRFGVEQRYGTFGSVGAGWNLVSEPFLKNAFKFADVFKLRGSVGTSGNFDIGGVVGGLKQNYTALGLYSLSASYGGLPAEIPSQLTNTNLTWEKNNNWGVGLEVEALNSRIRGTVEYYYRKTSDLIFNQPVSQTTGFTTTLKNIGELENKGIETKVDVDIIRNRSEDFKWTVTVSYSNNNNKITKLYGGKDVTAAGGYTKYSEGYPVDNFFLSRWAGVDPATGSAQWYDKEGKIVQTYSAANAVILPGKSPDPTFFGNFGTSLSYKGLELSGNFYYSGGNYVYNLQYRTLFSDGNNGRSAQTEDALNYWKNPGDVGVSPKPKLSGGQTGWDSDRFLQKGDYIRLRNVTLSYSLPTSLIKPLKMSRVRIYAQGQNLATWTSYKGDPEVGYGSAENGTAGQRGGLYSLFSYPQSRTISGGIDVTF